ncbi:hypothetical protein HDC30_001566 [Pseudomonas sp. JAI115]|uniref:hypothetical protein n=1 Tax=Pseudomonas sp. JAI115 TaxID=2723061 RepID=UPI00184AE9DE|nr:hypothetical protein [Pseudomonas sp. JAI115]MBB6154358.1 hypothetical protein [Pseudomonas sp. JAI115]
MKSVFVATIKISDGNDRQEIDLVCNREEISIAFICESGCKRIYFGCDFYKCFALLRKDNPELTFFCKGAKINVHPSSMSSQMSLGLKAYQLVVGKEASLDDLVYIFDYEDQDLTSDPDEQRFFI